MMLDSLVRVSRRVRIKPFRHHLDVTAEPSLIAKLTHPQTSEIHTMVLHKSLGTTDTSEDHSTPSMSSSHDRNSDDTYTNYIPTLTQEPTSKGNIQVYTNLSTNWFHSLPFQQFQALLTLFSKSFSSFPHGTCLLSVSNQYLALDEIYHPFSAPRPKGRDSLKAPYAAERLRNRQNGIFTLHDLMFQSSSIRITLAMFS